MKKYRLLLTFTVIIIIFYAIYLFGLPKIINIEKRINFIEKQVQKQTGYNFKITSPKIKMGYIPSVWFMADDIVLLNDNGTKPIELKNPAIKVYLFPLLFKEIHIGDFSTNSIKVNLVYTKDDKLKLGQYPLIADASKPKMTLSKAHVHIGKYKISLKDYKQNKDILLDGKYFNLDEFQKNKKIKLSTNAKLFVGKKASDIMADIDIKLPINIITEDQFKLKGHIANLDLADFSDYVKSFPKSNIKSLSGKINLFADTKTQNRHKDILVNLSIDNLGIMQNDIARSIYCKDKINVDINATTIKNGINIENMTVKTNGVNVNIKGQYTKLNAKIPHTDTTIEIKKSRTENFIPLMPGLENFNDNVNSYALKKMWFYGDIEGELKVKGRFDTPYVDGQIRVTNGYVVKPIRNNTPKATITLDFKKDLLYMDIKVPAPDNQAVFVKGWAESYGEKRSDLMITSTNNVDLKVTQEVLNPLHEILKFDIGPVPIMDIKGIGNIKLHIKGTKEAPHGWGYFNFRNTTASFLDIKNMTLTSANGELTFDDLDTHFITKTAYLHGKPIIIDGKCNLLGKFDFDIIAKQQDAGDLLKIVQTSPMLKDIQAFLSPINSAKGTSDFILNVNGQIKDINNIVFNNNLFAKGNLILYSVNAVLDEIPFSNISGKIGFDNMKTELDLSSNIGGSNVKINGKINDKNANLKILSNNFVIKDGLNLINLNLPNDISKIHTSFVALYKGNIDKINPDKLNVKGKIYSSKGQVFSINNSSFELNNSNFKTSNITGLFKASPYDIKLNISNVLTKTQSINGTFDIKNFNFAYLNGKIKDIKDLYGIVNLKGSIKNNGIYTNTNLNNIGFIYVPDNISVKILNGKMQVKKDVVYLHKINSICENMPIFINGKVSNIYKNPTLGLYISTKLNQDFIDQIFNNKTVYPIKIKGDINLSSNLSGHAKAFQNKTRLHLADNASIYYMGATLGNSHAVEILTDNVIYPTHIKINNFKYDKLIRFPNGRIYTQNQLNALGSIYFLPNNNAKFVDFKIKTQQPTDAKIFNMVFRKPFMKQGIFTSDLTINGTAFEPELLGKLHVSGIDIPVLDATINDMDLNFKKDKIYLASTGTVLNSNMNISAIMGNSVIAPYIFDDININIEKLDLNRITSALQDYDVNTPKNKTGLNTKEFVDFSQIIIKKAKVVANNILIKNLNATDFFAHLSLNEKMQLNVSDYHFDIADGNIAGSVKYNLLSNAVNFKMKVKDANSQILTESFSDLRGQIYGAITSDIDVSCNGKSQNTCTQTLNGKMGFTITDGRMPKLGSLEYLLRAGDLLQSGITGLSIKGIIDLITPYKTGNFDKISGNLHISNGIADDIQIYSYGKALNMYLKGKCNLTTFVAEMHIFGALTKDFKTIYGKIGNLSLNTLFNTLPGITVSDAPEIITEDIQKVPNSGNNTRMFNAEISGDINGNNYVRSFKWLK